MSESTLARIYALHAEALGLMAIVEGMKAKNADRERRGESQAYGEELFATKAKELGSIAATLEEVGRE